MAHMRVQAPVRSSSRRRVMSVFARRSGYTEDRPRYDRGGNSRGYDEGGYERQPQRKRYPKQNYDQEAGDAEGEEVAEEGAQQRTRREYPNRGSYNNDYRGGYGRGGYNNDNRGGYGRGGYNSSRGGYNNRRYNNDGAEDGEEGGYNNRRQYRPREDGVEGSEGGEEGGYNNRRTNYRPRNFEGEAGEGRPYYNNRRNYGDGSSEGGEEGGERRQYRPRYNNYNNNNRDQGGSRDGGERTWGGPRLSEEELARRDAISRAITEANSVEGLMSVIREQADGLDAQHVVTMLHKMAKEQIPRARSDEQRAMYEELLASLYGYVAQQVGTFRSRQVATGLYSVARLQYFNQQIVSGLTDRAYQVLSQMNSTDLSNSIWAMGKMSCSPGEVWLDEFCYRTQGKLQHFNQIELANTTNALSKLGYKPSDEFMTAVKMEAMGKIDSFGVVEYVALLYALANLGVQLTPEELEVLVNGRLNLVDSFRVADLSRCIWALTQFGFTPNEEWQEKYMRQLRYCMRYATPQDLSTILYSLAFLNVRLPDQLKDLALFSMEKLYDRFPGDELANCALAFAIFRVQMQNRFLDKLLLEIQRVMPTCTEDGLRKVVQALPALSSGHRLNEVVAQAQARLAAMEEAAAAVVAEPAMADLGLQQPAGVAEAQQLEEQQVAAAQPEPATA